jgi:hypothetical protein
VADTHQVAEFFWRNLVHVPGARRSTFMWTSSPTLSSRATLADFLDPRTFGARILAPIHSREVMRVQFQEQHLCFKSLPTFMLQ